MARIFSAARSSSMKPARSVKVVAAEAAVDAAAMVAEAVAEDAAATAAVADAAVMAVEAADATATAKFPLQMIPLWPAIFLAGQESLLRVADVIARPPASWPRRLTLLLR